MPHHDSIWTRQGLLARAAGAPRQKMPSAGQVRGPNSWFGKYGPTSWGLSEGFAGASPEERWGGAQASSGKLWTADL